MRPLCREIVPQLYSPRLHFSLAALGCYQHTMTGKINGLGEEYEKKREITTLI